MQGQEQVERRAVVVVVMGKINAAAVNDAIKQGRDDHFVLKEIITTPAK